MGKVPFDAKRKDCLYLPPEKLYIETTPGEPFYDPRANLDPSSGFIANVIHLGILEPILIARDGDKPIVVAGRQRVKAAIAANKKLVAQGAQPILIPCILKQGSECDYYEMTISENEHRRDDDPFAKSEKLKRYLNLGGTIKEAATLFGVSEQTIRNWEKQIFADEEIKQEVREGNITLTEATKIAEQPLKEQKKIAKEIKKKNVDIDDLLGNRKKERIRVRKAAEVKQLLDDYPDMPSGTRQLINWFLKVTDELDADLLGIGEDE